MQFSKPCLLFSLSLKGVPFDDDSESGWLWVWMRPLGTGRLKQCCSHVAQCCFNLLLIATTSCSPHVEFTSVKKSCSQNWTLSWRLCPVGGMVIFCYINGIRSPRLQIHFCVPLHKTMTGASHSHLWHDSMLGLQPSFSVLFICLYHINLLDCFDLPVFDLFPL